MNDEFLINLFKFQILATEGWGPWSEWSLCDDENMQIRKRKCLVADLDHRPAPGMCQGRSQEERVCIDNLEGIKIQF